MTNLKTVMIVNFGKSAWNKQKTNFGGNEMVKEMNASGMGKRGPKPKPGAHKIVKEKCTATTVYIPFEQYKELAAEAEKTNSDIASVIRTIVYRAKKWPALERNG